LYDIPNAEMPHGHGTVIFKQRVLSFKYKFVKKNKFYELILESETQQVQPTHPNYEGGT
jgi:hypothetical protein